MAQVTEISLQARTSDGVTLLDAVLKPTGARVTAASDSLAPEDILIEGAAVRSRFTLLSAAVIETGPVDPALRLVWPGGDMAVTPTPPETAAFAGRRVGLAMRIVESAATARDWLDWHHRHHGMEAALIVDRARTPGFASALAAALADRDAGVDVAVLRPGVPLGKSGFGPEAHRYFAPDAPGRDHLEPPAEDRWHAPLGEIAIFEVLRHRFLAEARSVTNLDLSDLAAPLEGGSVFERAETAPGGVVRLAGRHAYPWRVPPARDAGFGDHICRLFDRDAVRWRWCVAPDVAGEATTWRLLRVSGAAARRRDTAPFWRCMALRHPGHASAEIAPKSGLVEDDAQVVALGAHFAEPAERLPQIALETPKRQGSVSIVTTVKDEAPFLVDWIAWHRAMGAKHFLIYSNDCTDGTEELLRALHARGVIVHRNNDDYAATGKTPQHSVLAAADRDAEVRAADWTLFSDADEYVNVKVGSGRFSDLFAAMPDANMISLTWRLFGNADVHGFEDVPVFEQFTSCAPELCRKPHQAWGFKTLFRNLGIFKKLGVHRPKGLNPQLVPHIRWKNGSGRDMPLSMFRNGWRSTAATYGYEIVQLNHYAVRSAESFLVKRARGRANHVDRDQGLNYWFRMNNNAEAGGVNPAMRPLFEAEKARLMALPGVAEAHAEGVRRHRAKIAELKVDPVYAAFYATLTSPRLERLSRLLGHFGAGVFHAGPDAVPDERVFGEWRDGEFFTVPVGQAAE